MNRDITYRSEATLSAKTKAADLLAFNCNLVTIMSRMGLKLGFGEATVGELCRKGGVDVNTFLLVCNVYTFSDYTPSADALAKVHVEDIIRYLRQSHVYYLNSALTYLQQGIEDMIEPCKDAQKAVIRSFCAEYIEELRKHFAYEEDNVFSYAEHLIGGKASGEGCIDEMEDDHSNIEEKVGDLKNIVMKYLPAECETDRVAPVLTFIFLLSEDLERHTFIEDNILIPMIKKLEDRK